MVKFIDAFVDPIGSRNAQIYELRSELKSLLLLVDALIDDRIDIKDIAEEIVLIKSRNLFLNEDDSWKDIYQMSMNQYTHLMTGIKTSHKELKKMGLDLWGDDLLPWRKGDKEVSFYHGEGIDSVYIGKVIATSEPYADSISQKVQFADHQLTARLINEMGFSVSEFDIDDWIFDLWR